MDFHKNQQELSRLEKEFSQRNSQPSQATIIVESTPSDEPNSPSVEEPCGTVYFSNDSSYFQDFSAFQKQNFPIEFQFFENFLGRKSPKRSMILEGWGHLRLPPTPAHTHTHTHIRIL